MCRIKKGVKSKNQKDNSKKEKKNNRKEIGKW